VKQEYDFTIGWAFVKVMNPVFADFDIVWIEIVPKQVFEPGIGSAKDAWLNLFAGRQKRTSNR
jgi:hypothetical protein